jgi:predicted secreted protein
MTSVRVAVGQAFTVRLQSTPTTGYVWQVQSLPEGVQLSGSDFESGRHAPPGSPLTQVFRFRVVKAGQYTVTLVLKRQWESQPIQTHLVTVDAR